MILSAEAKKREQNYALDPSIGCYMYFFSHKTKIYCVDATSETKRLGRLINHSRLLSNCITKVLEINKIPHLFAVASRKIQSGEELLFDYGERNKSVIQFNPWLKE